jgi:hypothetical protein
MISSDIMITYLLVIFLSFDAKGQRVGHGSITQKKVRFPLLRAVWIFWKNFAQCIIGGGAREKHKLGSFAAVSELCQ